jgi:alkylhydroperoxidase family enzyme
VIRDYRASPIDDRLKAMLGFLEKVTLRPTEITAADAQALLDVGLEDVAIREAINVVFIFNFMTRCADAFDFELPRPQGERWIARVLLWIGYDSCLVHG